MTYKTKYNRILLKYSGEALTGGKSQYGIEAASLERIAKEIAEISQLGIEIGIVIGGGNLFRGKTLSALGISPISADHIGMLATVMNGLALRDALERLDLPVQIMSALPISSIVDPYYRRQAINYLHNKHIVIFAAGTGNPLFTTDSAACLRAIEIGADIVLKATKVDGIYSADPIKHPNATKYDYLSYKQVLNDELEVMDATAICLCQEHNMPVQVFDMTMPQVLKKIILGERIGTIVGATHDQ